MNQTIEMLRNKAVQALDYIRGEQEIKLEIDSLEEEPLQANCKVQKRVNVEYSNAMMECHNYIHFNFEQLNILPASKDKIWIYNISELGHTLRGSIIPELKVPACKNEEYVVVTSLPAILRLPKVDVDKHEFAYVLLDGKRAAMDLINPSNLGVDQDAGDNGLSFSYGNNYGNRGVFFSEHNPPLKKDLRAAHSRMKKYYAGLLEKAKMSRFLAAASAALVPVDEFMAAETYIYNSVGNK